MIINLIYQFIDFIKSFKVSNYFIKWSQSKYFLSARFTVLELLWVVYGEFKNQSMEVNKH